MRCSENSANMMFTGSTGAGNVWWREWDSYKPL